MELTIKRVAKLFNGVRFQISESDNITAKYNMNGGLWLRKATVKNEENIVYVMKQREWFKKLLLLPLLFLLSQSFPEFYIYQKGEQIGKSFYEFSSSPNKIQIDENMYETNLHSKNYMSIFKNGVQIALLQRGETVVWGAVDYKVICDESFVENMELLLLLTAFLDIVYWRSTWRFSAVQRRVTVGKEKFPEMIRWRP